MHGLHRICGISYCCVHYQAGGDTILSNCCLIVWFGWDASDIVVTRTLLLSTQNCSAHSPGNGWFCVSRVAMLLAFIVSRATLC
jgi:hypothetical protein